MKFAKLGKFKRWAAWVAVLTLLSIMPTPVSAQNPFTAEGTLSAAATSVTLNLGSYVGVGVQVTGTCGTCTLNFEATLDGTNWVAVNMTPPDSTTPATTTTAVGVWTGAVVGRTFRVRMSARSSGSFVISIRAVPSSAADGGGGGGGNPFDQDLNTTDDVGFNSVTAPEFKVGTGAYVHLVRETDLDGFGGDAMGVRDGSGAPSSFLLFQNFTSVSDWTGALFGTDSSAFGIHGIGDGTNQFGPPIHISTQAADTTFTAIHLSNTNGGIEFTVNDAAIELDNTAFYSLVPISLGLAGFPMGNSYLSTVTIVGPGFLGEKPSIGPSPTGDTLAIKSPTWTEFYLSGEAGYIDNDNYGRLLMTPPGVSNEGNLNFVRVLEGLPIAQFASITAEGTGSSLLISAGNTSMSINDSDGSSAFSGSVTATDFISSNGVFVGPSGALLGYGTDYTANGWYVASDGSLNVNNGTGIINVNGCNGCGGQTFAFSISDPSGAYISTTLNAGADESLFTVTVMPDPDNDGTTQLQYSVGQTAVTFSTTGIYLDPSPNKFSHIGSLLLSPVDSAAPDAGECDNGNETGAVRWDSTNDKLYACSGASGWSSITSNGGSYSGTYVSANTSPAVANVGANSCGTSAASIAGTDNAPVITVGATAGTQCRVTFDTTAPNGWNCQWNNKNTHTLAATPYQSADTTTTADVTASTAFVAGDTLTGSCWPR